MRESFRKALLGALGAAHIEACEPAIPLPDTHEQTATATPSPEVRENDSRADSYRNSIKEHLRADPEVASILDRPIPTNLVRHLKDREDLKRAITEAMRVKHPDYAFHVPYLDDPMDRERHTATHEIVSEFDAAFTKKYVTQHNGPPERLGKKRFDLIVATWKYEYFEIFEIEARPKKTKDGVENPYLDPLMVQHTINWLMRASASEIDDYYEESSRVWDDLGQ